MNEILFNTLFDRKNDNPDFLRGRVASCIKYISDEISNSNIGSYDQVFYKATINYNDFLIKYFGMDFLSSTLDQIIEFKNFLFTVFNSENPNAVLKETDYTKILLNFHKLVKKIGYSKRSRLLRRYNNFIKISNNFVNKKLDIKDYKNELLNHILFLDDFLNKLKNIDINYICIYYFVYDIRASENVRKLKQLNIN